MFLQKFFLVLVLHTLKRILWDFHNTIEIESVTCVYLNFARIINMFRVWSTRQELITIRFILTRAKRLFGE